MPELPTSFDEDTEDDQSLMSESKSYEERISQEDHVEDSVVQKSIEDAKDEWTQSHDRMPSDETETK
jgi:hypothetical protein